MTMKKTPITTNKELKQALRSEVSPLLIGLRNELKNIVAASESDVKIKMTEDGLGIAVVKGAQGLAGKDAVIDYKALMKDIEKLIIKHMPEPRRGRPGAKAKNGRDGKDGKSIVGPAGKDGVTTIKKEAVAVQEILNMLEGVGIPAEIITGLDKAIQKIVANLRPWQSGGFGAAGSTQITLSTLASLVLLPTEAVDGSRTVFTFAGATKQPSFVIRDNAITQPTSSAGTANWTWNNLLKQVTFTLAPQDDAAAIQ